MPLILTSRNPLHAFIRARAIHPSSQDPAIVPLVLMASAAAALSDMTKSCLSVAAIPMAAEFGWSNSVVGQFQSALFLGFLLTQLPGGTLSKRFTGRTVLKAAVLMWSLGHALTPLGASLGVYPLCAARLAVGLGQGLAPTALTDVLARNVPPSFRARAAGAVFTGFNVGAVLSLVVTPISIDKLGWQPIFYAIGGLGVFWCVAWDGLSETRREREMDAMLRGREEQEGGGGMPLWDAMVGRGAGPGDAGIPWGAFFASSAVWAVIAGHFADNWGKFALTTWMPTFFHDSLGVDTDAAALLTVLPLALGIGVACFASPQSDALIARGWPVTQVRKLMMGLALFGPAAFLGGACVFGGSDPLVLVCLLTCAMGVSRFAVASLYCIHQDMNPAFAGTLLGITNTFGALAGVLSAVATGIIEDRSGSWNLSLFLPAMVVYCVGGIAWLVYADATPKDFLGEVGEVSE